MPLVENDDVIQAFMADGAIEAFRIWILPRRLRGGEDFFNAYSLEPCAEGDRSEIRIADLGCLEGGFAVEFARMGFQVVGIEVRENNIAACNYVKAHTSLPNLRFVHDSAWNIAQHGSFDAIFCCGCSTILIDRENSWRCSATSR